MTYILPPDAAGRHLSTPLHAMSGPAGRHQSTPSHAMSGPAGRHLSTRLHAMSGLAGRHLSTRLHAMPGPAEKHLSTPLHAAVRTGDIHHTNACIQDTSVIYIVLQQKAINARAIHNQLHSVAFYCSGNWLVTEMRRVKVIALHWHSSSGALSIRLPQRDRAFNLLEWFISKWDMKNILVSFWAYSQNKYKSIVSSINWHQAACSAYTAPQDVKHQVLIANTTWERYCSNGSQKCSCLVSLTSRKIFIDLHKCVSINCFAYVYLHEWSL